MARFLRVEALGIPHHVTQRGNARRLVFESDGDRMVYLSVLVQHAKYRGVAILGYCLMPNHVHLILSPLRPKAMQQALRDTHGRYAAYVNARQASSGHVWQGRYYSCPMDTSHLWNALRYVELNPVRAGLAIRPEVYRWSSARTHLCGDRDGVTDVAEWANHWTIGSWRNFVDADAPSDDDAVRHSTHCGRPLGSEDFIRSLESHLDRKLSARKGGRSPGQSVAALSASSTLAELGNVPSDPDFLALSGQTAARCDSLS